METVRKGLQELEEEQKERAERRKMAQKMNREVWQKQIQLKKRHNMVVDPRSRVSAKMEKP